MTHRTLTADGRFTIEGSGPAFEEWLPRSARIAPCGDASLSLSTAPIGVAPPGVAPTLSLLDVGAWIDGDHAVLHHPTGDRDGTLDLGAKTGALGARTGAALEPLLTLAGALLLGRLSRALVHSAAVVDPDGRAWLILGDTHSGKSTTTATLARAGWGWLADDQVILARAPTGLEVEGWPRSFNLDAGYVAGEITGRRVAAPLEAALDTPRAGRHPVAGLFLTHVDADRPTTAEPASAAEAFIALVRQSPWLLADPAAAGTIHQLLSDAASGKVNALSLGRDSYRRPEVLLRALGPMIEGRD